jgi:beta-1,4-mannosyltransferase
MLDFLLTAAVVASTSLTIVLLLLPSRYIKSSPSRETASGPGSEPKVSVQVLVLGDIGRSPRMQYHAMSIAKHSGRVDVIGYRGMMSLYMSQSLAHVKLESALHPGLVDNNLITIVPLPPPPQILRSNTLPFILAGPLKVLWQIWTLFQALSYRTKPARWLLVQVRSTPSPSSGFH